MRDVAGNETSDFSGDTDPCSGDPAPTPDDAEWSARVAEVRAVYAGPFEATLRWAYTSLVEPESPFAFWQARPSGYEPVTSVSGDVVLGASQFFEGRPTSPGATDLDCPDWFQTSATVELATADGALAGTAQGYFRVGIGPTKLLAELDLADAVGSMDLHVDPGLEYRGSADLRFDFYPEGKRGQIAISVYPEPESQGLESGYWPLTSDFPDDGCGTSGFPGTADVPLRWLEGQTPAQALDSWNTALQSLAMDGLRHDCAPGTLEETSVALSFELGAPERELCQVPVWPAARSPGSFSFRGMTRLRTSDGRLEVPLVSGFVSPDSLSLFSDESLTPWSGPGMGLIPADQFGAQTGILDVDPGNSDTLGYYVMASFARIGGAIVPGGTLMVQGIDCTSPESCTISIHSDLRWPIDESATIPLCRL